MIEPLEEGLDADTLNTRHWPWANMPKLRVKGYRWSHRFRDNRAPAYRGWVYIVPKHWPEDWINADRGGGVAFYALRLEGQRYKYLAGVFGKDPHHDHYGNNLRELIVTVMGVYKVLGSEEA